MSAKLGFALLSAATAGTLGTGAADVSLKPAPTADQCHTDFFKKAAQIPNALVAGTIDLSSPKMTAANLEYSDCLIKSQKRALTVKINFNFN